MSRDAPVSIFNLSRWFWDLKRFPMGCASSRQTHRLAGWLVLLLQSSTELLRPWRGQLVSIISAFNSRSISSNFLLALKRTSTRWASESKTNKNVLLQPARLFKYTRCISHAPHSAMAERCINMSANQFHIQLANWLVAAERKPRGDSTRTTYSKSLHPFPTMYSYNYPI